MLIKTHILFSFVIGLLAIKFIGVSNQIFFIILVIFGATLPDIDHPKSMWGRKFKLISWLFKHRGFFHSILILPLIALVLDFVLGTKRFTIPILIGYGSHLLGDMITKEGIKPFTPVSNWSWRGGWFKVGGSVEYMIFGALILVSGWLLLNF